MKTSRVLTYGLAGYFFLTPMAVQAEWFDNAKNAINVNTSRSDYGGASLHGGISLQTGHHTTTLMRGEASIGGGCSAFNFTGAFKEALETIPDVIKTIAVQAIAALPMVIVCSLQPILCDVAKHIQNFINFVLQSKYAQCQNATNAAMYIGLRLRGDQVSKCLYQRQAAGDTITQAMETCNNSPFTLTGPDGQPYREFNLIQKTLEFVDASSETQAVAKDLLGDITLRAGNSMGVNTVHSPDAARGKFEAYKDKYDTALRTVTDQYTDGTMTDAALRAASVPDKPLPMKAVQALAAAKQDPVAYSAYVGQLSTASAISQLTSDCNELEAKLYQGMNSSQSLGEAERKTIEQQLQALRLALAGLMAQADVMQKYYDPAVNALMASYQTMMDRATATGISAPAITVPGQPYRTQSNFGYTR